MLRHGSRWTTQRPLRPVELPRSRTRDQAAHARKACIGGVPGAALTRAARKAETPWSREWRGIFMFSPEHQGTMEKLADAGAPAQLEGVIEGRLSRLNVTLTGLASGVGLAFFEAEGEPY